MTVDAALERSGVPLAVLYATAPWAPVTAAAPQLARRGFGS
jgi:hypothetical protein